MKKVLIICLLIMSLCLTGCDNDVKYLKENLKRMELTGNLVTYEAYFHNILESEKEAGSGIIHLFEKNRRLFAEYTGTVKLGIDMSKVIVEVDGNKINVKIPKAKIIGEPNVDRNDFKSENFIESKEGLNKNPITANELSIAFDEAQKKYERIC